MQAFVRGFADELLKTASLGEGVVHFFRRVREEPELRAAIRKSMLVGAGTGLIEGAALPAASGKKHSRLKSGLSEAAGGAMVGGITGAVFPGWFHRAGHFTESELARGVDKLRR